MKPLNPQLKTLFETLLDKRGVPLKIRFHYEKWLRYYLDFCPKYNYIQTFPGRYQHQKDRVVSGPLSDLILIFNFNSNSDIAPP